LDFNMKLSTATKSLVRLVALVVATTACGVARGQTSQPTTEYELDFSTDFNLLLNPNDPVAQHFAMWKTPTQLASLRSAPMIRLTNTGASALPITSFRMNLGDPGYLFDSFAVLEAPNNGASNVVSHSDVTFGGDMENHLEWNFPSGLLPGDSFTFQVRLHRLAGGLANYEDVLWDKNLALFSPDRTDNAEVLVTFGTPGQPGSNVSLPAVRLFEYPLANADFTVDQRGASGYSHVLEGGHEMIIVGITHFQQAGGPVIPEPSSFALAGVAGCVLAGCGWRRRRRAR
jgi:hypothetical protein